MKKEFRHIGNMSVPKRFSVESLVKGRLEDATSRNVYSFHLPKYYKSLVKSLTPVMSMKGLGFKEGFNLSEWLGDEKMPEHLSNVMFTTLKGSSSWHTDEGLGLLLNWMVYYDRHSFQIASGLRFPTLITEDCSLNAVEIGLGDVFVFNANRGHAWVSNWDCAFLQIPVQLSQ
jgi:hypothetical protein